MQMAAKKKFKKIAWRKHSIKRADHLCGSATQLVSHVKHPRHQQDNDDAACKRLCQKKYYGQAAGHVTVQFIGLRCVDEKKQQQCNIYSTDASLRQGGN